MNKLDLTFAALSDVTRRRILLRLMSGPATVNELAQPFRMSQQAVSKHLACLAQAKLIRKHRAGRQQICSLAPAALRDAAGWIGQYRRFWEGAFERLDALLHEIHPPGNKEPKS